MGFEAVDGSAWTVTITSHQSLRLYAASRMMRSDSSSLRVGIRGPWLLVTHLQCDLHSLALSRFIDLQVFISDGAMDCLYSSSTNSLASLPSAGKKVPSHTLKRSLMELIVSISSWVNSQPLRSKLAAMRLGLVDLGMTE